jgi:putative peptidoglycan lipid II flippase
MIAEQARPVQSTARGVALAALLIALGNIASRMLGLGRVATIALFFGRGPGVDAYTAAWTIPNTIYDFIISGALAAALVPVFSEYAEGDQEDFWRIVSGVLNLMLLALPLLLALVAWQAPLVVRLLVQSSRPELRPQTVLLVRSLLPAVLFMSLAGLTMAVLYARRAFLLPAFAGAIFNAGTILGVGLLHGQLGVASLAAGALIGALGQLALQVAGLRGLRYSFTLNLGHPAVRRVLRLYAPVALGTLFAIVGMLIDRWLASGFPAALATMQYATTLIQLPLGLIAAAIALAVLPTLSRQSDDNAAFRQTLGMGLKLVLLLVPPATAGLAALASPVTALLFQRGAFAATDTAITATALLCYLPGLPAAAVSQVLLFAFYARKKTLAPNLVQGVAVLVYLLTALPLVWYTRLGFLGLVLGNSAQWIGQLLLLLLVFQRDVSLRGLRLGEALGKTVLASIVMAVAVAWLSALLRPLTGLSAGGMLIHLVVVGGLGVLLYGGVSVALRVEVLQFFVSALARLARSIRLQRRAPNSDEYPAP